METLIFGHFGGLKTCASRALAQSRPCTHRVGLVVRLGLKCLPSPKISGFKLPQCYWLFSGQVISSFALTLIGPRWWTVGLILIISRGPLIRTPKLPKNTTASINLLQYYGHVEIRITVWFKDSPFIFTSFILTI